ncbi:hypothetical protein JZ751_011395 [Albula glossodonta]|uniref:SH3 domain-containing protein n=1 Tax=Albula glossodonta TaxID=121402 RepID=A0A8T2N6V9_9TELE|nr:hypothetical protein JZ751_011395 [Albula glossodonta]
MLIKRLQIGDRFGVSHHCKCWVSVLQNSKEEALNAALGGDQTQFHDSGLQELARALGVHYSRIQSLTLDMLSTSELLLAVSIGNTRFNDIMEAGLPNDTVKPLPQSDMNARKEYIVAKYAERRYVLRKEDDDPCRVHDAVKSRDLTALLQLYAEGEDLAKPMTLPQGPDLRETALHLAVRQADRSSLALVDFLTQNSGKFNSQIHLEYTWETPQEFMYDSEDDLDERVSPLPRNLRSPLPTAGGGASPSRWSFTNTSVSNKTYENVDLLYRNPPANSAPSGGLPPPLPAKAIQRGRSDPQISISTQEGNPPVRRSSNPASSRQSPPSVAADGQASRAPRSPHGGIVRGHRQTKTTSYRRTSSGGQGKCTVTSSTCATMSPAFAGSQEELYSSLAVNASSPSSSPIAVPMPRPRRNAMVSQMKPRQKRVQALVDCRAVSAEQLEFFKDEVIVVTGVEDPHWWVGHIEGDASRSGSFPVNYVHKLSD